MMIVVRGVGVINASSRVAPFSRNSNGNSNTDADVRGDDRVDAGADVDASTHTNSRRDILVFTVTALMLSGFRSSKFSAMQCNAMQCSQYTANGSCYAIPVRFNRQTLYLKLRQPFFVVVLDATSSESLTSMRTGNEIKGMDRRMGA